MAPAGSKEGSPKGEQASGSPEAYRSPAKGGSDAQTRPDGDGSSARGAKVESSPASGTRSPVIVGVGASAGGYEAFVELLRALSPSSNLAIVYITHQAPTQESELVRLLARATEMEVREATAGQKVEAGYVYLAPPHSVVSIRDGALVLEPKEGIRHHSHVIDRFFRALADDQGSRAVGVLLSGSLSDGSLGIREIHAAGGYTFAQSPPSARFPEMPHSAIQTGSVQSVLSPADIGTKLAQLSANLMVLGAETGRQLGALRGDENEFQGLLRLLKNRHGVDFTGYKRTTLARRVHRRMIACQQGTLRDYVAYVRDHPSEAETLFEELLIQVTRFFRDDEMYDALRGSILPSLLDKRSHDQPLRVWIPGCATGEEAYSMAILLDEYISEKRLDATFQVFATDVSERAIQRAREGSYPDAIEADVSKARLIRYFRKTNGSYQVDKVIRGRCVFAIQDVTRDAPFSNIDVINCRNVLIYFEPATQSRVLSVLHYALRPNGFLLLGAAETPSRAEALFQPHDALRHVFTRRDVSARYHFIPAPHPNPPVEARRQAEPAMWAEPDIRREADRLMLHRLAPSALVVRPNLEIVLFRGKPFPFLEHPAGAASLNLLRMVPESLAAAVREAVKEADEKGRTILLERVRFSHRGRQAVARAEVIPFRGATDTDSYFLILLSEGSGSSADYDDRRRAPFRWWRLLTPRAIRERDQAIERLEGELQTLREHLQSIVEDYEASTEELHAANEEALSGNEELQSTNEELETAKEELQSTNEELVTLNEELQLRNVELQKVYSDLVNLINSMAVAVLMLGADLRIRRYTPEAEKILNLIPTDVGRPITDLNLPVNANELRDEILEVVRTLTVRELRAETKAGGKYEVKIHPYRTTDNRIDGSVVIFRPARTK